MCSKGDSVRRVCHCKVSIKNPIHYLDKRIIQVYTNFSGNLCDFSNSKIQRKLIDSRSFWLGKTSNILNGVQCQRHSSVESVHIRDPNLTHWARVTHICVSELSIIGSDNSLASGRRQAIIWTNAGILLIGPLGTNFSEILIEIVTFSYKNIHLKMSSRKWRPFCLGLNVLSHLCTCRCPN